jgi:hypothetical protein
MMNRLNLFYEEPDPDRWVWGDRFPRRLVRRIVRGPTQPGGVGRVFLNLRAGLDRLGVPYRFNDYRHLRANPEELACVVGKPHVLDEIPRQTPILFGPGGYGHPIDNPDLLSQHNIRAILVLCEWMRIACIPAWGDKVMAWPTGIGTDLWAPDPSVTKDIDLLIYDKIRWRRDELVPSLMPVLNAVAQKFGLRTETIRYGFYREEDYHRQIRRSRAMVFLCEHETQGLALLQALACDVPVFAWDRGGDCQDPLYYPDRVKFGPVSSVPYWDERCGRRFADSRNLPQAFEEYWHDVLRGIFRPREFILDNLTLEACARRYVEIARQAGQASSSRVRTS